MITWDEFINFSSLQIGILAFYTVISFFLVMPAVAWWSNEIKKKREKK